MQGPGRNVCRPQGGACVGCVYVYVYVPEGEFFKGKLFLNYFTGFNTSMKNIQIIRNIFRGTDPVQVTKVTETDQLLHTHSQTHSHKLSLANSLSCRVVELILS